ncbi:MAG: oxygenase MpaB family protein [Actinomycetota bacterium]
MGDAVNDPGFFGPDSVSWQVHRETFVLFGGARALLLQAAHPLVIAGATLTGFYERNPWKRLMRTLQLTYAITFASKEEALASAAHINEVHERVHGIDPVTGLRYDALDPDLLLWVHACLVDSALRFEQALVGKLDHAGRERFHQEQMLTAELLRLPRERIPATVADLRSYMASVIEAGILRMSPGAEVVAGLFKNPPPEAEWRPVLKGVSRWAFGMLPAKVREIYGVSWNPMKDAGLRASLAAAKLLRPAVPKDLARIEIARRAEQRARAL